MIERVEFMGFAKVKAFYLLIFLLPGSVSALDVEAYGGLAAGYAVREQPAPANDHMDSGEKAYVGLRFLGPVGVEFAYYNLGTYNNKSMEVTALGADAVFSADIRGMSLFAKAGILGWEETDLGTGAGTKGQDVTYGIGVNLAVDRHVLFRTELEYFRKIGKDDATNDPGTEMSLLSFGINFSF